MIAGSVVVSRKSNAHKEKRVSDENTGRGEIGRRSLIAGGIAAVTTAAVASPAAADPATTTGLPPGELLGYSLPR
jgi:hypothetical protein